MLGNPEHPWKKLKVAACPSRGRGIARGVSLTTSPALASVRDPVSGNR